ncbi:MAG TPA: DUF362 domain-containing protein [Armatimonadota bacterium]|nr:DUF362 domain-containing protein [Armatimonadota bacterium]
MSKVLYGPAEVRELRWQSSLPGKLDTILGKLDIASKVEKKRVCIKMHLGSFVGYSTIHPLFVRRLVSFIKTAGGQPFVTDILPDALSAHERGYTQEVLGCPILPAAGASDSYYHTYPVNYKTVTELRIAGEVCDAEYLISLSHAKGHGNCGYGGAIKNLAIGAMTSHTRTALHMVEHAERYWYPEKCTHFSGGCNLCVEACKVKCMRFAKDNTLHVGFHECNFCFGCNELCPEGALTISDVVVEDFQELMALATEAVLSNFPDGSSVSINFATNITPLCDCFGMTTPNLVPDIGIFASEDIVAVEKATLDSIDYKNLLPGSVPQWLIMRDVDGHLFKKIHGKDPYIQVYACERRGLGSTRYEIEEVD